MRTTSDERTFASLPWWCPFFYFIFRGTAKKFKLAGHACTTRVFPTASCYRDKGDGANLEEDENIERIHQKKRMKVITSEDGSMLGLAPSMERELFKQPFNVRLH
jgi:hypothetical protein